MFAVKLFTTQGSDAEVKAHQLKPSLTLKTKSGHGETQVRMYESQVAPYPNDKCFETKMDANGVTTTKRHYLTPEKVIFIHLVRSVTKTEKIIDARIVFVRTVPSHEFNLMLPISLEPYFA